MPTIPIRPSDSSAVVEYKIRLDSEMDAALTTPAVVQKWRRYYDGWHDLLLTDDQAAFLGKIISAEGTAAARKLNGATITSTDWPIDNKVRRIVDRVNSRLNVVGLTDDSQAEILFEDAPAGANALASALRWWKASDLDTFEDDLYRNVLRDDEGYLLVWHDGAMPRLTVAERYDGASGIRAVWEDDARTKLLYATKHWTTVDPSGGAASNVARCNVYTASEVRKYVKPANDRQYQAFAAQIVGPKDDGGWYPIQDPGDESWPIAWVDSAGRPFGVAVIPFVSPRGSLVQAVIGLQNALNKTNLDLLAAADQLGFGMIVARYPNGLPPTTNAAGQEIDPSGVGSHKGLGFRPGVVLETDAEVSKLAADDLAPLRNAARFWAEGMASNSDVPMHEVSPLEGQVPSGAALRMLESGFTSLVEKCQTRFGSAWRQAFDLAQLLAQRWGGLEGSPTTIYPLWKEAAIEDPTEKATAQVQEATRIKTLTEAGLPLASTLREVGWDEERIARALAEKKAADDQAQESLATQMLRAQRLMESGAGMGEDAEPMGDEGEE